MAYVLSFRARSGQAPSPEHEAAWGQWLREIGADVVAGDRVGRVAGLGETGEGTALGGYVVINADDYDAATALAKGCPGIQHGGGVEVGEIIPS